MTNEDQVPLKFLVVPLGRHMADAFNKRRPIPFFPILRFQCQFITF